MPKPLKVDGEIYPRKVTQVYQVSIPAKLLRRVGLDKDSAVSCALSADFPGAILLFSSDRVHVDGGQ